MLTSICVSSVVTAIRLYVISQMCGQVDFVQKYGKWAVVTGGAGGIGRGVAEDLARRGMSLVIIDIDQRRLAETKRLLESEPNVGQVEAIQADLADSTPANFEKLRAQLEPDSRDIGVLVNNVGMFPSRCQEFDRHKMQSIIAMANANMLAMVRLTRMIMPGMLQRRRGLLLNVSSVLGSVPMPYMSVYAPTKAFVDSFTRQLQMEYSSQPIDIVLLKPALVRTNILGQSDEVNRFPFLSLPETFARSALNAVSSGINTQSGLFTDALFLELLRVIYKLGLVILVGRRMRDDFNRTRQGGAPKVHLESVKETTALERTMIGEAAAAGHGVK
jgi:17beta-estradiol 17-dehydrogenase / very-long-chain 3-oxoacyl-CoA reductase